MKARHKTWIKASSYFSLLAAIGHASGHYVYYIDLAGFSPERLELAKTMMAFVTDPSLNTSMWTLLQMYSLSFSLLWLLFGTFNLLLLRMDPTYTNLKIVLKFDWLFCLVSCILYIMLDPVIQSIVISGACAALYLVSWIQVPRE